MAHRDIQDAIRTYAKAYARLQEIQNDEKSWVPGGDQKTGSIGEYYAFAYLKEKYPESTIKFGSHTQKGWDISVSSPRLKVQVKAVSAFSKTRTISPIHPGWDELYLIFLDKELSPAGFWILEDNDVFKGNEKLQSKKCPIPGNDRSGSAMFKGLPQNANELIRIMKQLSNDA